MACRGVHFALSDEEAAWVLAAKDDEALLRSIEQIEERWDVEHLEQTDKTWAAIHRVLTDGTTNPNGGRYPLNRCILGGRQLYKGDDYIVSFVEKNEVRDLAPALQAVTPDWFRARFAKLKPLPNEDLVGEEHFPEVWEFFQPLVAFYKRAAQENRSVIFTVDQ